MNNLYFVGYTVFDIGLCTTTKCAAVVDAYSASDAQHQFELKVHPETNYEKCFSVYEIRPFRLDDFTTRGLESFAGGLRAQGDMLTGVLFLPDVKA